MVPKALIIVLVCVTILNVESIRVKKKRAIDRQRADFQRTNTTSDLRHRCNGKVTGSSGNQGTMSSSEFPLCHCKGDTEEVTCNFRILVGATCPCSNLCRCDKPWGNKKKPKFDVLHDIDQDNIKMFCGGEKPACTPSGEVTENEKAAKLSTLKQMNRMLEGHQMLFTNPAPSRYIISMVWLDDFSKLKAPGPIDNKAIYQAALEAEENLDDPKKGGKYKEFHQTDNSDIFPQLQTTLYRKKGRLGYKLIAEEYWKILKENYGVELNSELHLSSAKNKVDYSTAVNLLEDVPTIKAAREQGASLAKNQRIYSSMQPKPEENPFKIQLGKFDKRSGVEWGVAFRGQWFKTKRGCRYEMTNTGGDSKKWNGNSTTINFQFPHPVHVSSFDSRTRMWLCDKPYKLNRRGNAWMSETDYNNWSGGTPRHWQVAIPSGDLREYFEQATREEQRSASEKWNLY